MAAAEKQFSRRCIESMKGHGFMLERIENSSGNGTPDLNVSKDGVDCWIELKCCNLPKRTTTKLGLKHIRKGQIQWHRKRSNVDCETWILVQVGKAAEAQVFAFKGIDAKRLAEGVTLSEAMVISEYHYGGTKADLVQIIKRLHNINRLVAQV